MTSKRSPTAEAHAVDDGTGQAAAVQPAVGADARFRGAQFLRVFLGVVGGVVDDDHDFPALTVAEHPTQGLDHLASVLTFGVGGKNDGGVHTARDLGLQRAVS